MKKSTSPRDGEAIASMTRRRVRKQLRRRAKGVSESRDESGETLLEILLALIILSLASVALITAFGTSINASAEHRSLASFDTVLASSISTTTSVLQQQYADVFTACQPLSAYPSQAALTADLGVAGYTAAIGPSGSQAAVEYSNGGSYSTSCSSGAGGDVGNPQLINVVVTDTATGFTQNDTVVVDNPTVIQTTGVSGTSANSLIFTTQPEGATVNSPFAVQPILEVQYCSIPGQQSTCSVVTSDLSPISSLTISSGPSGASLSNNCSSNETAGVATYSGCSLNVVGAGYTLFASEPDPSDPGSNLTATSAPFSVYAAQLITPTITSVVSSTTTAGAINVSFTGAPNAPANQAYSVKACTDIAMSIGCVVVANFTSGSIVSGLVAGTSYYASVTAAASQNFLGSTSPPGGPAMATEKLATPAAPTLADGTSAGTLIVTYAGSSNAPTGETYSINVCTNQNLTSGCVTNSNFVSGGTVTVPYTPGTVGQSYYAGVTANASTGYLASVQSPASTPLAALSSVKPPTVVTASPSATQAGAITVAYTPPVGGAVPSSYTATVCTDAAMSQNCTVTTGYLSGHQLGGLTPGTTYYATIIGVSTTPGYLSTAPVGPSSAMATVQLTVPTITSVGYGSVVASVSVAGGSSNAQPGATYTAKACTNQAMTTGCVTYPTPYTPGTNFTGLTYTTAGNVGTTYWVTLTAINSTGYIASATPSAPVSGAETGKVGVPGTPTGVTGTMAQTIVVTFAAPPGVVPSGYTVQACTGSGMTGTCFTQNVAAAGQFTFTGLQSGTKYYLQVTDLGPTGYVNNISSISPTDYRAK